MARGYAFDLTKLFTTEMLIECGRERFFVATSDVGVGRELFVEGSFDGPSFERTFDYVARQGYEVPGRVFLDVGANIGTTSVMAITRLGCSHVFAFEPSPSNVRMLRQNILANELEGRITPVCAAVSEHSGQVEMRICDTNSGDHRISGPDAAVVDGREVVSVDAVSLDSWLDEHDIDVTTIGVVWIDAQGHEPYVLDGARGLLVASDAPVVCEYWPHGLREAGSLERMGDILTSCDRNVIELGEPSQAREPRLLNAEDIARLADRYSGTNSFCDLLLLKEDARDGRIGGCEP